MSAPGELSDLALSHPFRENFQKEDWNFYRRHDFVHTSCVDQCCSYRELSLYNNSDKLIIVMTRLRVYTGRLPAALLLLVYSIAILSPLRMSLLSFAEEAEEQLSGLQDHEQSTAKQQQLRHQRLLAEAGKRYWSRPGADDGPQLPVLPDFYIELHKTSNNSRRRHLSSAKGFTRTGHDSFQMIGNSPLSDYGIGISDGSNESQPKKVPQQPEHPRNHKDSKKSSKESSGGKGINTGGKPTRPPAFSPTRPPGQPPVRPPSIRPPSLPPPTSNGGGGGGVCQSPITMQFLQFSAIPPAILVFPQDPNVQDMGTRYIYNNDLRDAESLDELVGSRGIGVCTRTQSRLEDTSGAVLQLGGGHCTFTYTMFDGSREFSMEASGTIFDSLGGTLSIVGGTKDVLGAFGEITLVSARMV
jgi:hypothetical protein